MQSIVELIQSPRLHLRPLSEQDGDLYIQLYSDPQVMGHIAAPMEKERASESFKKALVIQLQTRPFPPRWILRQRDSGAPAGLLGLNVDADGLAAEIGVMLLPAAQGAGYGTEAIGAMAGVVFERQWTRALWARHASANLAAGRLVESLGFALEEDGSPEERRWRLTTHQWRDSTVHCSWFAQGVVVREAGKG